MKARDIILDSDLSTKNGDIVTGESDSQHIEHIIKLEKGQNKKHPLIGVGIDSKLNASLTKSELEQLIRVNLDSDNIRLIELESKFENGEQTINVNGLRKNEI